MVAQVLFMYDGGAHVDNLKINSLDVWKQSLDLTTAEMAAWTRWFSRTPVKKQIFILHVKLEK